MFYLNILYWESGKYKQHTKHPWFSMIDDSTILEHGLLRDVMKDQAIPVIHYRYDTVERKNCNMDTKGS